MKWLVVHTLAALASVALSDGYACITIYNGLDCPEDNVEVINCYEVDVCKDLGGDDDTYSSMAIYENGNVTVNEYTSSSDCTGDVAYTFSRLTDTCQSEVHPEIGPMSTYTTFNGTATTTTTTKGPNGTGAVQAVGILAVLGALTSLLL